MLIYVNPPEKEPLFQWAPYCEGLGILSQQLDSPLIEILDDGLSFTRGTLEKRDADGLIGVTFGFFFLRSKYAANSLMPQIADKTKIGIKAIAQRNFLSKREQSQARLNSAEREESQRS